MSFATVISYVKYHKGKALGLGLGGGWLVYKIRQQTQKKRVLVIPFHRMVLKDQIKFEDRIFADEDGSIVMETKDVVDAILKAAKDPSIVALHGIFGHGTSANVGWADAEEIRSALKVFKESHRVHCSPNLSPVKESDSVFERFLKFVSTLEEPVPTPEEPVIKPMYAFADSAGFQMEDYYLASIFTNLYLQESGRINFFGVGASDIFVSDMLKKYKIKAHTFQFGDYKNMGNIFTHNKYTKAHRENQMRIVVGLSDSICGDILDGRFQALQKAGLVMRGTEFDQFLDFMMKKGGTFTSQMALEKGLIDGRPARDPVVTFWENSKKVESWESMFPWLKKKETPDSKAPTVEKVASDIPAQTVEKENDVATSDTASSTDTTSITSENQDATNTSSKTNSVVATSAASVISSPKDTTENMFNADSFVYLNDYSLQQKLFGLKLLNLRHKKEQEKVALLYAEGLLDENAAEKLLGNIREIKKDHDVKCVVLRVNSPGGSVDASERISKELQLLNVPYVVSMGNYAASGGYWISAHADRIFASSKTITGSIGVIAIRPDVTGFADSYGITFDQIESSEHAGTVNVFQPMTKKMETFIRTMTARYYDLFKDIVSKGRGLPIEQVENLAAGRTYTGDIAKDINLVDEIGGLNRALSYAQLKYTRHPEFSRVVLFDKNSILKKIYSTSKMRNGPIGQLIRSRASLSPIEPGIYATMDEQVALSCTFGLSVNENDIVSPRI